jgi:hypothetical protein
MWNFVFYWEKRRRFCLGNIFDNSWIKLHKEATEICHVSAFCFVTSRAPILQSASFRRDISRAIVKQHFFFINLFSQLLAKFRWANIVYFNRLSLISSDFLTFSNFMGVHCYFFMHEFLVTPVSFCYTSGERNLNCKPEVSLLFSRSR